MTSAYTPGVGKGCFPERSDSHLSTGAFSSFCTRYRASVPMTWQRRGLSKRSFTGETNKGHYRKFIFLIPESTLPFSELITLKKPKISHLCMGIYVIVHLVTPFSFHDKVLSLSLFVASFFFFLFSSPLIDLSLSLSS